MTKMNVPQLEAALKISVDSLGGEGTLDRLRSQSETYAEFESRLYALSPTNAKTQPTTATNQKTGATSATPEPAAKFGELPEPEVIARDERLTALQQFSQITDARERGLFYQRWEKDILACIGR